MMNRYLLILWSVLILLMLVITACSPSRISVAEYDQTTSGNGEPTEVEEAPPTDEEGGTSEVAPPVKPVVGEVPEDVPVMEDAYDLQAGRRGNTVVYQVDATIEDVVSFYQEELPKFGWELAGPPDSAIGAIATMLRENSAGDRLAINMQSNELGGFVTLTITIDRVK